MVYVHVMIANLDWLQTTLCNDRTKIGYLSIALSKYMHQTAYVIGQDVPHVEQYLLANMLYSRNCICCWLYAGKKCVAMYAHAFDGI